MPRTLALLMTIPIFITGCCKPCPPEQKRTPCTERHDLTSLKGNVTQTELQINPTPATSCPPKTYITGDYTVRIEISFESYTTITYSAIVGPNSKVALMNDGSLYLCKGWVYVWHVESKPRSAPSPTTNVAIDMFPWVQTDHIIGGAEGSAIAARVEADLLGNPVETYVYGYKGILKGQPRGGSMLTPISDIEGNYYDASAWSSSSTGLGNANSTRNKDRQEIKRQAMDAGAPDPAGT